MARSQPYTVACDGGLLTSSNSIDLLKTPGVATRLQNFEVSIEGGYRRVNGYANIKLVMLHLHNQPEALLLF